MLTGPRPLVWSGGCFDPQPPGCWLKPTVFVFVWAGCPNPPELGLPSIGLSHQSILPSPSLLSSMCIFGSSRSLMLFIQFVISLSSDLKRSFVSTSSSIAVPACRCRRMWLELRSQKSTSPLVLGTLYLSLGLLSKFMKFTRVSGWNFPSVSLSRTRLTKPLAVL